MLLRAAAGLGLAVAVAGADVPLETLGSTERLREPPHPHWVFVGDLLLRRSALLDLDRSTFLGMVSSGFLSQGIAVPRRRAEFYVPETYYSRGSRGERTDVVTIYDAAALEPVDEVAIPPRRAINVLPSANAALSDDDRFLAVFNMTPATSLSVVDVEARSFAGEIATPGCSLVYAGGERRFLMLCADGSLLTVTLDEAGQEAGKLRSEPFFDPNEDPVTEKAVRYGDRWLFVSFEGQVHAVDVSGDAPRVEAPWSLLDEADREDAWRIGGIQHLAVHAASGRLYSLMHRGGADTHKQSGSELWVYDLGTRERTQRIALHHPGFSFMGDTIEFGKSWPWPFNRLSDWLLDSVAPNPGLDVVAVTQDAEPLLVTGSKQSGSLAVYDARSGRFLRRISSGNFMVHAVQAPWSAP
ncbi:MAG: amine dehydrogenase [Deltaproteobacteria bacterium]|nr:MAG: amine dehydrogenase [Deltaproteobacteria bacterium]